MFLSDQNDNFEAHVLGKCIQKKRAAMRNSQLYSIDCMAALATAYIGIKSGGLHWEVRRLFLYDGLGLAVDVFFKRTRECSGVSAAERVRILFHMRIASFSAAIMPGKLCRIIAL